MHCYFSVSMDIGCVLWYPVLAIISTITYFVVRRKTYCRLPPGPPGWPILGNMFQLGSKPNESLSHFATKYGPLMSLSLGMKTTVVASSPAMAKEVLKTHDHLLAGRPVTQANLPFTHSSLSFGQIGPHWRMLRRISTTELFSVKKTEALQHLRRDQVYQTIRQIYEDAVKGKCVNIGHTAFNTTVNLLGNMIFGTDMSDPDSPVSQVLQESIAKLMELHAVTNLADSFPFLQWFRLDPQGISRTTVIHRRKVYAILDKFIQDHLAARGKSTDGSDSEKDLLDVLLDMRSDEFTLTSIKIYLTEIFGAGTDTSATTIEWAMAELIRNPQIMERAQAELDEVVGRNRMVEESDTDRLPYLHAVIKEVFRLHPPVPLLLPHRADSRCEIAGFVIPKHSRVLVNLWAIGRDPAIWNEPLKFAPGRFMGDDKMSTVEYKGQHFELIPFGAGRRMCVGFPLATRMIHLVLACLLHSFEWAPPEGTSAENVDMTDTFGMTLQKAVPLEAIPTPRLPSEAYN